MKTDVTPLSGDPMCTETIDEWAEGMLAQLDKMSMPRYIQTLNEMTDDERDAIRSRVAKFDMTITNTERDRLSLDWYAEQQRQWR